MPKLPKTITLGEAEYHCEAIELAIAQTELKNRLAKQDDFSGGE